MQAILIYDGARGPRALKEQQQEVMNTYSFATSPRYIWLKRHRPPLNRSGLLRNNILQPLKLGRAVDTPDFSDVIELSQERRIEIVVMESIETMVGDPC